MGFTSQGCHTIHQQERRLGHAHLAAVAVLGCEARAKDCRDAVSCVNLNFFSTETPLKNRLYSLYSDGGTAHPENHPALHSLIGFIQLCHAEQMILVRFRNLS